ncbi:hypothetical protein KDA00_01705 [Candidatus Saccharibacteria bacterium]|nr:hypothetical protein [Candidatus Saccharibacteria bacterium]
MNITNLLNFKSITKLFSIAAILFVVTLSTGIASAATTPPTPPPGRDSVCEGIGITGGDCDATTTQTSVSSLVANVISILSWVVGVAAVIMIMIGGFKYITSQGDANSINSAKNTILYAIVGLAVALFAQLIVMFVVNKV